MKQTARILVAQACNLRSFEGLNSRNRDGYATID